jgi:AcrR family transcriptional regulator
VEELPLARDGAQRERADAARNRAKILAAAEALIAERGIEHVSMDDVARAAAVGKGTLYRRFGDRASLAHALLHEHETALQEAMIRGEPPLGPGAGPRERLHAFGQARLDLLERHGAVLAAAEIQSLPAPYGVYRAHLAHLIREASPEADHEYLSDALLGLLTARLFFYQRAERGLDLQRIKDGWCTMVDALCGELTQ